MSSPRYVFGDARKREGGGVNMGMNWDGLLYMLYDLQWQRYWERGGGL